MADLAEALPALRYREVTLPKAESLVVHALSDVHVAAGRHQSRELRKRLDMIGEAGPNHRLICHGDWADIRTRMSKGYSGGSMTPQGEIDAIVPLLKPLADRIDLIIPGNHEDRIERDVDLDFMGIMSSLIGCTDSYRAGPTVIRYRFAGRGDRKGERYDALATGLVHHGVGGGSTGASVNRLKALVRSWCPEVDFGLMGHVHDQGVWPYDTYRGFPPRLHRVMVFLTGTFVDHEMYAQKFGLPPSSVGAPEIHLTPDRDGDRRFIRVSGWVR